MVGTKRNGGGLQDNRNQQSTEVLACVVQHACTQLRVAAHLCSSCRLAQDEVQQRCVGFISPGCRTRSRRSMSAQHT